MQIFFLENFEVSGVKISVTFSQLIDSTVQVMWYCIFHLVTTHVQIYMIVFYTLVKYAIDMQVQWLFHMNSSYLLKYEIIVIHCALFLWHKHNESYTVVNSAIWPSLQIANSLSLAHISFVCSSSQYPCQWAVFLSYHASLACMI